MANEKKAKKNAKKAAVQPVQLSEDEELFIVERVIGKRRLRGEVRQTFNTFRGNDCYQKLAKLT